MSEEYIKKEISKAGFPLELEIHSMLQSGSWIPIAQGYYFDDEEGKSRNIDISAMRAPKLDREGHVRNIFEPFNINWNLAIECKKSSRNWVFFPIEDYYLGVTGQSLSFLVDKRESSILTHLFGPTFGHYDPKKYRVASTYTTLGKGKDEIFEATMQLIKYITYSKERMVDRSIESKSISFWFPIIVFEGKMWDVSIERGEVEDIRVTKHIHLKVHYRSPEFEGYPSFAIDIVHKSHFSRLLEIIEQDIKEFSRTFLEEKNNLLERFKFDSRPF